MRQWEQELQTQAQTLRSLEGERAALEGELAALRERAAGATAHRADLQGELAGAERRRDHAVERAGFLSHEAKRAAADAEHARHLVAEAREQEAMHRSDRRRAEEALAQMTARRQALEELERDRVGLAPAAAALLAARERFDGGVLGPLSDFVSTGRDDAELAERLLGDWMHAVLVRDRATVRRRSRRGTPSSSPARSCSCRSIPGRITRTTSSRSMTGCGPRGRPPAGCAPRSAGSEVLDAAGRVLKRASGAIFLSGAAAPSGPLRRRAELSSLVQDVERATAALAAAEEALQATIGRLAEREQAPGCAPARPPSRPARPSARARSPRDDALRIVGNLAREMTESETQLTRITERLTRSEQRLGEIDAALVEGDLARSRLEEELGGGRSRLGELETEQEAAREQRVHWQVQEAHVAGGLRSADERLQRAGDHARRSRARGHDAGRRAGAARVRCHRAGRPAEPSGGSRARSVRWRVHELEAASGDADAALADAEAGLTAAEREVTPARTALDLAGEESHTPAGAPHRIRRVTAAASSSGWRPSGGGRSRSSSSRRRRSIWTSIRWRRRRRAIVGALEAIGPVNAARRRRACRGGEAARVSHDPAGRPRRRAPVADPGHPRDRRHRPLDVPRDLHGRPGELLAACSTPCSAAASASCVWPTRTTRSRARSTSTRRRGASGPSASTC